MTIDILLVLVILLYTAVGWRNGFFVTAFSLLGLVVGVGAALAVGPPLIEAALAGTGHERWSLPLLVVAIVALTLVGTWAGSGIGHSLRQVVDRAAVVRVLDSIAGAVAAAAVTAVVGWAVLTPLAVSPWPPLNRAIESSTVLRAVDDALPAQADGMLDGVRALLSDVSLPDIATVEPSAPPAVDAPDAGAASGGADRARGSVVRLSGQGARCEAGQTGSGWVVADGLVMTNAHVVAALEDVWVIGPTGDRSVGSVVSFDPDLDVALVAAPALDAPELPVDPVLAEPGADAAALGHPYGGTFRAEPARVRAALTAVGTDIYGEDDVERQVYALRGSVAPGMSGGPLVDVDGEVAGMIFARSAEHDQTAYALTPDALAPYLAQAEAMAARGDTEPSPVGTGACLAH
jgi:S1-C subfamily serine protease